MINRAVTNPGFDFRKFDFFNDYADTIYWLGITERLASASRLQAAYADYQRRKKSDGQSSDLIRIPEIDGVEFVFWVCPNNCNSRVEWNKECTLATCLECGETSQQSRGGSY